MLGTIARVDAIILRPAAPADAPAIAAIYAPYVGESAISFEETPPDAEVMATRMSTPPKLPWWVAIDADMIVGYAYAAPHRTRAAYRWSVEVSVYLAPSHSGRGLGTRLYRQLLPDLRGLGYVNAYAGIALPNPASVRLHERVGFTTIGAFPNVGYKHGRWHDVGWWHLALTDPPADPSDPLPSRPAGR